jgi:hypothetical protein
MTTPQDEALDRRVRMILAVVDACRRAMVDLVVEDKAIVVERLNAWVELEPEPSDMVATMASKAAWIAMRVMLRPF